MTAATSGCLRLTEGTTNTTEGPAESAAETTDPSTDSRTSTATTTSESGDTTLQTINETTNVRGASFVSFPVSHSEPFVLDWTVRNERSPEYDFDVFLFTASEFQKYEDEVDGEWVDSSAIHRGSEQGITGRASESVRLDGGRYVLVVDNTDIGDAGDFGTESRRRVSMSIETTTAQ